MDIVWRSLSTLNYSVIIGVGVATYVTYYLLSVPKKPALYCRNKKYVEFLENYCPVLKEKYWPTFWCIGGRVQTILRLLVKKSPNNINFRREIVGTSDGGQFCLDWLDNNENNSEYPDDTTRPTVVILPGLTGCSEAGYVRDLAHLPIQHGYRSVIFNYRGLGKTELKTPRTYSAASTEDLHYLMQHIQKLHPEAPITAVGVSLGGVILFNYIAKHSNDTGLVAAMTISTIWDTFKSADNLETPLNRILFNRPLASMLVGIFSRNLHIFENHLATERISIIKQSQTIREFDMHFTSHLFKYKDVDEYYTDASLHTKLHQIKTPVLCLNAADDPFSPLFAMPIEDAKECDRVALAVTTHGGHIGFCEGTFPRGCTFSDRVYVQFIDAVFQHRDNPLFS